MASLVFKETLIRCLLRNYPIVRSVTDLSHLILIRAIVRFSILPMIQLFDFDRADFLVY